MIRLIIENNVMEVAFLHDNPMTACRVDLNGESFFGFYTCEDANKFNKERGRKGSLADAIRTFDKRLRTFLWAAYFARRTRDMKQARQDLQEYIMAFVPEEVLASLSFDEALAYAQAIDKAEAEMLKLQVMEA